MDLYRGLVHAAQHQIGGGFQTAFNAQFNRVALFWAGLFQDPVHHFSFVAGVVDADAQSPIVCAAQLPVDVAQAVVPGMAAAQFQFGFASGQVELVVRHQNFLRLDFEEPGQTGH